MRTVLIFSLMFILFCSCKPERKRRSHSKDVLEEIHDEKLLSASYGRHSNDLVEKIYLDVKSESEKLKAIENDLSSYYKKYEETNRTYQKYINKSENYYKSASAHVQLITDSTLRNEMTRLISDHKAVYESKTAKLKALYEKVKNQETAMLNAYNALKIKVSLEFMTNYQKDKMPASSDWNTLLNQSKELENKMLNYK